MREGTLVEVLWSALSFDVRCELFEVVFRALVGGDR